MWLNDNITTPSLTWINLKSQKVVISTFLWYRLYSSVLLYGEGWEEGGSCGDRFREWVSVNPTKDLMFYPCRYYLWKYTVKNNNPNNPFNLLWYILFVNQGTGRVPSRLIYHRYYYNSTLINEKDSYSFLLRPTMNAALLEPLWKKRGYRFSGSLIDTLRRRKKVHCEVIADTLKVVKGGKMTREKERDTKRKENSRPKGHLVSLYPRKENSVKADTKKPTLKGEI